MNGRGGIYGTRPINGAVFIQMCSDVSASSVGFRDSERARWISLAFLIFVYFNASALAWTQTAIQGHTMGTTYNVKVVTEGKLPEPEKELKAAIDEKLLHLNNLMSTWDRESELSRFNADPSHKPFPVSEETIQVLEAAGGLYQSTKGLFDPTVGPLVDLWGFGPKPRRTEPPSIEEIAAATAVIGMSRLVIDQASKTISKSIPGLRLDLSAVVPGFAADTVADLLAERGYKDTMVDMGGEIAVRGLNRNRELWSFGIDSPTQTPEKRELVHTLLLTNAAVATSGDYRNNFVYDGVEYAHILNPKMGWPILESVKSVTVIAPNAMRADGAATAIMVMGATQGLEWAMLQEDLEALILYLGKDGEIEELQTRGMRKYFKN